MPADLMAALKAKLAKKKKPRKAKKARAKKPMKDALGVSGGGKTVSKVNPRGTAKAKRQAKAKSPRRISTKAAPDSRGFSTVKNKASKYNLNLL